MDKRSMHKTFQALSGLARGLLCRPLKLVNDTIFFALVIYCVGCIVPTTLDQQSSGMNYSPVFVTALVDPPFGPIARSTTDAPWQFKLTASDPNIDDLLHVRLMISNDGGATLSAFNDVTTTRTPSPDPTANLYRSGQSEPPTNWCANFGKGTHEIYAFVADLPYIGSSEKTAGLEDSNHWELTCK